MRLNDPERPSNTLPEGRSADCGNSSANVNGAGDFEKEAARMSAALVSASADTRLAILVQLRDSKGGVYTEALGAAVRDEVVRRSAQQETRAALAKRLTRMTSNTLREMFKDANREIRCAPPRTACSIKNDRQFVSDLIGALADSEELVAQSARASLKVLSAKDFGPLPGASAADKNDAIRAWKEWSKTQAK